MTRLILTALLTLCLAAPAVADGIKYYEDPVYVKMSKDDPHPMQDLLDLADQGDSRAQFILGDLYGKGKGGLGKNQVKSRFWFETAARNGYTMGFVRLAAMAKRERDLTAAYKWYTLDIDHASGKERHWSEDRRDELKLSKNEMRAAHEDLNDWLSKREKQLADEKDRERAARDEAARLGKVIGADDKKDTTPVKQTQSETPSQKQQEFHYNE